MKRKSFKYCKCGCGRIVRLNRSFIWGHSGVRICGVYNNGLTKDKINNRWYIVCRDNSQIAFARTVMECFLERNLSLGEVVHHKDRNTENDKIENLMLFSSPGDHTAWHHRKILEGKDRSRYKKISESKKGSHLSIETKKKISESNKGRRLSKEARANVTKANRKRMVGYKWSEEVKKKISVAAFLREERKRSDDRRGRYNVILEKDFKI